MCITHSFLKDFKKYIEESKIIIILTHDFPDGDAFGSVIAMTYMLRGLGKEPMKVFSNLNKASWNYIEFWDGLSINPMEQALEKDLFDLVIVLDSSNIERLGSQQSLLGKAKYIINIDHHMDNSLFGNVNLVKPAAAVGEILKELIDVLGIKWTYPMAFGILASIISDTGRFMHRNTHRQIFSCVYELLELVSDKDYQRLVQQMYTEVSFSKIQLQKDIYANLEILDNIVAFSSIVDTGNKEDNLVDYINCIEGISVAVLVRKLADKIKISFRSRKEEVTIRDLAAKFGGGGHLHAAGATIPLENYPAQLKQIKQTIREYFR